MPEISEISKKILAILIYFAWLNIYCFFYKFKTVIIILIGSKNHKAIKALTFPSGHAPACVKN
jgi:hypothetical protein